jgi:serine/threonine-protein kinase
MLTLAAKVKRPSAIRPDVPPTLDAIVLRALERDVEKRYQTAFDMRMELQDVFPWSGRDTNGLAKLMRTTFAEAIVEQKRLVSVLMALSDSTPPSGRPSSRPAAESGARPKSGSAPSVPPPAAPPPPRPSAPPPKREVKVAVPTAGASNQRKGTGVTFALAFAISFGLVLGAWSLLTARSGQVESPPPASEAPAKPTARRAHNPEPAVPAAPPAVVEPAPPGTAAAVATAPSVVVTPPVPLHPAQPRAVVAPAAPRDHLPPAETEKPSPPLQAGASVSAPARVDAPSVAREPGSPEATGSLTFDTTPWSIVSIGGRSFGQTPLIGVKLPAGVHTLVLKNPELGLETTYVVKIEAGKAQSRRIGLE